ncbi:MAG TPA: carbon-nitrogen hydrolase family protein [Ktedonobacterales bacterium]|nr:carbon-nitrogen hydrolase family protein [Ktedonobacterales bacterium]
MALLQVALLQMTALGNDQQENLAKGVDFCRKAQAMGADVALFPEMWNIGYTPYEGYPDDYDEIGVESEEQRQARTEWQEQAVATDGEFVGHFRRLARELEMAIGITYLERWLGAPRNTISLIDRHGEIALIYAKVHTCDFSMECACTPGDGFHVCTLDTAHGPVNVGSMICYDREFPESARILMLKGAEILLVPNACEMELNRMSQLRARAYENMVGIALANYAAPQENGHSVAFDGIAFANGGSRDMLIVAAGEQEGIYLAPFDLETLRDYRSREGWGNAYRKPHRYGALTAPEVAPPFIRTHARGERDDDTKR